jgi:hypothetical protein
MAAAPAAPRERSFRIGGLIGHPAGGQLQAAQRQTYFQDGATPSPLRVDGQVGIEGDCEVLDHGPGIRTLSTYDFETALTRCVARLVPLFSEDREGKNLTKVRVEAGV